MKERLDKLLVSRGFFPTREKARRAVMAGKVTVDGVCVPKAGKAVDPGCDITVAPSQRYVSRGGEKLAAALKRFDVSPIGKKCLDIGSSTGGFTDCLLQAGAETVVAVDVGYGQLDFKLRGDSRVTVLERTNARYLKREDLPCEPQLVTIDVSFISLGKIVPAVRGLLKPGAEVAALVKPQFEAGRSDVQRGGVVKDSRVHARVLDNVCMICEARGFTVLGLMESPLKGPAGNKEFFIYLQLSF